MCKCGLKAQWSTQPRASVATPWVPPVLEQSRPERAKALKPIMDNVIAIVFHTCFYANNSFCSHVQLTKGAYFLK